MSGVTAVRERSKRCFTRDYATVFNKRHPRVDISSLSRKATFFPLLVATPPAATGLELPRCFIYEAVEKSDRRGGVMVGVMVVMRWMEKRARYLGYKPVEEELSDCG